MSEERIYRKDNLQEDVRDTAHDTESGLDEVADKMNESRC